MRRLALMLGAVALTGCNVISSTTLGSGTTHEGGTIASDETWAIGKHTVSGAITVSGAKLIIEAGSSVTMAAGSSITVGDGGSIAVNGTSSQRVVFTSENATPGDWSGIVIEGSASNTSIIQNANILYAGAGQSAALTVQAGGTLTLSYTRIERSADYGLQLQGRTLLSGFQGNAFIHNALGPAAVDADSAEQLKGTGIYTPNDLEGVVVEASTLGHSATWQDLGVAYVTDDVTLKAATGSATLTLNANVIVQVLPEKAWNVSTNGALVANGAEGHPVIFSSSQSTPAPGDWHEIDFARDSLGSSNKLSYVIVEYGGGDPANPNGEIWLASGSQVAIDNSLIQYSGNYGIQGVGLDSTGRGGKLPNFASNQVANNANVGVAVTADAIDGLQPSSAYGPNFVEGVLVAGGTVSHSCSWQALGTPYVVHGDLTIGQSNGTTVQAVTIGPGAEFRFSKTSHPSVQQYGQLTVSGTAAQPVVFTAESLADGWNALVIRSYNDHQSSLSHAQFSYGGAGAYSQLWLDNGVTVVLGNVTFSNLNSASACNVGLKGTAAISVNAGTAPDTCPSS